MCILYTHILAYTPIDPYTYIHYYTRMHAPHRPRSKPTICAQFLPGAPWTPPPGCDPAEHKYNPFIGVLWVEYPGAGRIYPSWCRPREPWKMLPIHAIHVHRPYISISV